MLKRCMLLTPVILGLLISNTFAQDDAPAVPPMKFTDKGLYVGLGRGGGYTFEYPTLLNSSSKVVHKIIEKRVNGEKSATVKYEGGIEINLSVDGSGQVKHTFKGIGREVASYSWHALISYSHASGGTWQVNDGTPTEFPVEQAKPPHLYQGSASKFVYTSAAGPAFELELPTSGTYLQLTDNREWGWKIFSLRINAPINPDWKTRTFRITSGGAAGAAAESRAPVVDEFGQDAKMDFPQKVKSLDELKADVAWEKEYYAKFKPPTLDQYGGLPGSREALGLEKTGFFHVEKKDDRWYLVDPEGNAFFYLGLCAFQVMDWTYTQGREDIYAWLPPKDETFGNTWKPREPQNVSFHLANMTRKYGKTPTFPEWMTIMFDRVRILGFNGAGAFSGGQHFRELGIPHMAALPTNPWGGLKYIPGVRETFDPFNEQQRQVYLKACKGLAKNADDPMLIGYYMFNEPLYEELPKVLPSLDGKWAAKRKLVETLQQKYGTIEAFNTAWKLDAKSFDDLNDRGLAVTTKEANADVREFTGVFLDTLFSLLVEGVKANDPNHMIVGARLQPGTANNEQVCRILGKYVDVFSLNYYTYYPDPNFVTRIHNWSGGKPMIWSEFHWSAPRESGLPGGVRDVSSHEERGLAYRNYVERAATLPFVVGIEWFTVVDEPRSGLWFGKYGGDNTNTGIFTVTDRPWVALADQMAVTNHRIYDLMAGKVERFVYDNPKFSQSMAGAQQLKIARPAGPMVVDGKANGWPGLPPESIPSSRLVDGASGEGFEANFRLCWDDENLYVLATVTDPTPMQNKREGANLWAGDGIELFIGFEKPTEDGPLLFTDRHILLGAGSPEGAAHVEQESRDAKIPVAVVQNVDGNGYALEAAIPFEVLGFKPTGGQRIKFDLAVDDSANGTRRERQLMWNGTNRNSRDRGAWGTAEFLK